MGGDRPSQTAHLTLSTSRFHGPLLEFQYPKGGIPTSAPPILAYQSPCLPPILYMLYRNPISSYSKAPRGLSVLSQVTRIFTGITSSPSPSLRQCPNRYAFRAGRNLPDKEFRYLRTVIVTAAVYRGFGSMLWLPEHFPLTFRHRAGVSPYTSSFDFAGTCVFDKQSLGPFLCDSLSLQMFILHDNGVPLLPKLRGYFAEFLNEGSLARLRILTPPTCVGLRYGHRISR